MNPSHDDLEAATVLLYGMQYQAIRENHILGPLSRNHLNDYLSKLEAEISSVELKKLEAQAEAMSLDELIEYALKALGKLKLIEEVAAEA